MALRGLVFDLDGVLTDTARFHFLAWKRLADELSMHFTETDNERLKGVDRMASLDILLSVNGAVDAFDAQEKIALATRKNDYYKELIGTMTPDDVLPGIRKLIDDAHRAGLGLAVASVSKNAPFVLDRIGLANAFDYVADPTRITRQKPDPEIFTVCAEGLGLRPCDCVGIEDAQAGIEAIHAAGMASVGIRVAVTSLVPDLPLSSTAELKLDDLYALCDRMNNKK